MNPIVWDDDDLIPEIKQHIDGECICGDTPSPPLSPSVAKELYLMCLRCPTETVIEYDRDVNLDTKIDCTLPGQVQMVMTICRTCLVKNGDYSHSGNTGRDLHHMMRCLSISPHYVRSMKLYKFLLSDRMMDPHLVTEYGAIKYIPLEKIMFAIDDTCILKSMTHSKDGYVRSHLRGGFF